jgi:hypothetical protein
MSRRPFPVATFGPAAILIAVYGLELSAGVEPFCLVHGFEPAHSTFGAALVRLFLHAGLGAAYVLVGRLRGAQWRPAVRYHSTT